MQCRGGDLQLQPPSGGKLPKQYRGKCGRATLSYGDGIEEPMDLRISEDNSLWISYRRWISASIMTLFHCLLDKGPQSSPFSRIITGLCLVACILSVRDGRLPSSHLCHVLIEAILLHAGHLFLLLHRPRLDLQTAMSNGCGRCLNRLSLICCG